MSQNRKNEVKNRKEWETDKTKKLEIIQKGRLKDNLIILQQNQSGAKAKMMQKIETSQL